jgi:hypothetical protein
LAADLMPNAAGLERMGFFYGVASWLDPANRRFPPAVVTERAFEFVLPSRAREPRTVTTSPGFSDFRVQP